LLAIAAMGQGVSISESPKKPGDPLRYTITLDSPVKGTVNQVYVSFGLTTGIKEDQKDLPQVIELTKFVEASPTEYKVDGLVPHVMSGTYLLNTIQLRTKEGGIRIYSYPADFKQENKITVENPEKNIFPNIKSVAPSH